MLGSKVVTVKGEVRHRAGAARTRYQVCSISKQMVATVVLRLVERNVLDLHEPIQRWFPDAPYDFGQITLHHLLTHTSGVGHWSDVSGFRVFDAMPVTERIASFQRAPLLSAPGERWCYSSPGYILVGHVVAEETGEPYDVVAARELLSPLGLANTTVGMAQRGDDVARGHESGAPVREWDLSRMPGTGDVWSTVDDIATFTRSLHLGELLKPQSLQALTHPHVVAGDGVPYGYGVYLGEIAGQPTVYHTGDNPGFRSISMWLPDREAAVVVLSNDLSTDVMRMARRLAELAVE